MGPSRDSDGQLTARFRAAETASAGVASHVCGRSRPQDALEQDAPVIRDEKEGQSDNRIYHWESGDGDATERAFAEDGDEPLLTNLCRARERVTAGERRSTPPDC